MVSKVRILEVSMQGRTYHCPLHLFMTFLGGGWKAAVLAYLKGKPQGFSELLFLMPEISRKTLALQLKNLEKDDLVSQRIPSGAPPRAEYSLTNDGKALLPALSALSKWGRHKAERDGKILEFDGAVGGIPSATDDACARVAKALAKPGWRGNPGK